MTTQRQIRLSLIIGLLGAVVCLFFRYQGRDNGDFWWALHTALAIIEGIDPYAGLSETQVSYPLPIAFVGFLFLWVPNIGASTLFVGISTGLLVYGALKNNTPWHLGVLLSYPYIIANKYAQWGIIIMVFSYIPILLPLLIIKPQVALPVALMRKPSSWGLGLTTSLIILSFIIMPDWPMRWLATTGKYQYAIPILVFPLGPLLILSIRYWRDSVARMLFFFSILPHRAVYDILALWLCARNWAQSLTLTALSWLVYVAEVFNIPVGRIELLFIPCLILIFINQKRTASDSLSRGETLSER